MEGNGNNECLVWNQLHKELIWVSYVKYKVDKRLDFETFLNNYRMTSSTRSQQNLASSYHIIEFHFFCVLHNIDLFCYQFQYTELLIDSLLTILVLRVTRGFWLLPLKSICRVVWMGNYIWKVSWKTPKRQNCLASDTMAHCMVTIQHFVPYSPGKIPPVIQYESFDKRYVWFFGDNVVDKFEYVSPMKCIFCLPNQH